MVQSAYSELFDRAAHPWNEITDLMMNLSDRRHPMEISRIASVIVLTVAAFLWPAIAAGSSVETSEPRKWSVGVYGAIGTDGGIEDFPGLEADFNDAYMLGLAVGREFWRWSDKIALGVEGQFAQHFVKQDHTEVNLLLTARWLDFPWNNIVNTSIAVGEGVSFASTIPDIERQRSPDKTSKLLNYLMFELELAPPGEDAWSVFTRIHHRSGVQGLYNGVSKGSNLLGVGVRYRF
jgi:hypothetical protein